MSFSEWKEVKLSEIMNIIGGGTPKTKVSEYWNGNIPWLSIKDFNNDIRTVYSTEKNITQFGLENSSTKMLNKGDIIISARGTVGALAQLGNSMAFNQSCYGLRANNRCTNDFLYYLLKYKINTIKKNTHGSVFDTITRKTFDILTAFIPQSNSEQKAISKILSSLDEKIEVNEQINKKLEEMAEAIFKHWFVEYDFPDENGEPYKSSGGKMVESELGMAPEGWEVFKIVDLPIKITDYVSNGSFKSLKENVTVTDKKDYALFIRNTDLKNNFKSNIKYVNKHSYEYLKKTKLYGGEVIISNVGDVGSVYLCPHYEIPMTLGNNVILVNSLNKDKFYNYYLYRYFKSSFGQKKIKAITGGSVQSKFNKTDFRNLKIIIPDYKIIKIYNIIFNAIEKKIFNNYIQNEKLSSLRDTLLPKLMSGEIRVPLEKEGGTQ